MNIPINFGIQFTVRFVGERVTSPDAAFVEMAAALEAHPDYRVLRRLKHRDEFIPIPGQPTRTGIILDVETTDTSSDEAIELGMVKFA